MDVGYTSCPSNLISERSGPNIPRGVEWAPHKSEVGSIPCSTRQAETSIPLWLVSATVDVVRRIRGHALIIKHEENARVLSPSEGTGPLGSVFRPCGHDMTRAVGGGGVS